MTPSRNAENDNAEDHSAQDHSAQDHSAQDHGATPSGAGCALRPALPADEPFLRRLFAETHPALQMLPPALRPQLAAMQYVGRSLTYAANYPAAQDFILLATDAIPAGRLLLEQTSTGCRCIDIAILPEHQRRGLGTAALRLLQQQAADAHSELRLSVTRDNPALRLYLRLGFQPIAEDELSCEMRWTPTPPHLP